MQNERRKLLGGVFRHSPFNARHSGMTLIELLIVITIIGVLISAVMVASTSLIARSKTRNTQAVLQIVADAVEQFKRSEAERPTITRNARYKARYGLYPPDELEVFSALPSGVPGALPPTGSLATPARSVIVPPPPGPQFLPMRFYMDDDCSDSTCQSTEHRDLAALIVAIESQGGEAAAILDRISDRNRSAGVLDSTTGQPVQYLNRPAGINGQPEVGWQADDLQIRYILDDWGNPITYFAQRDFPGHGQPGGTPSSNLSGQASWNEASTELIRLNGGQPVIASYGPDGKEQLKREIMGDDGAASIAGDFNPTSFSENNQEHIIDHPANADNVYSNDQLREKLAKGISQ